MLRKYFLHIQVTTLRISPKVLPLNRARYLWGCSFSLHLVELSTPETWNPQVMPSSKRFHFSHIFISLEFTTLLVLCFQCWVHTCAYNPAFSTGTFHIFWRRTPSWNEKPILLFDSSVTKHILCKQRVKILLERKLKILNSYLLLSEIAQTIK